MCAVLFWAHAVAIVAVAFGLGFPVLSSQAELVSGEASTDASREDNSIDAAEVMGALGAAIALGIVASGVWLAFLATCAEALITCVVWTSIAVNIACAVIMIFLVPFASIFFVLMVLLSVWFWCSIRDRIPFAASTLALASNILKRHWGAIVYGFLAILINAVWVTLWVIAVVGVMVTVNKAAPDASSGNDPSASSVDGARFSASGSRILYSLDVAGVDDDAGQEKGSGVSAATGFVGFLLLISLYWGSMVSEHKHTHSAAIALQCTASVTSRPHSACWLPVSDFWIADSQEHG